MLPLSDVILDVTITPNRPDVMSILGIARELGAYYELPVRQPDTRVDDTEPETAAAVEVEDPLGCPRFVARQVSGITVGPSPLPAQLRLRAAGVRPISNVVGAGNYVMIEMGHPIHTFDLARIAEGRLNIRRALEGEQLRTLDGVDRRLLRDDIVVADPSGAVALAGVMGGESTEVSETTREVLVEAANWDPASVLATAPTRSPLRGFGPVRAGRGPQSVGGGRRRAAALLASLGGGHVHEALSTSTRPRSSSDASSSAWTRWSACSARSRAPTVAGLLTRLDSRWRLRTMSVSRCSSRRSGPM